MAISKNRELDMFTLAKLSLKIFIVLFAIALIFAISLLGAIFSALGIS